jgi:hypothetical protein
MIRRWWLWLTMHQYEYRRMRGEGTSIILFVDGLKWRDIASLEKIEHSVFQEVKQEVDE